jgi:segregation and condensation protein A
VITNNTYPVKLPAFEGPLDLLLFLIRKHEIDIYDIPLETVTRQYLKTLFEMEQMQLEVAGEFFVMAATLMEIKSRTLLPKDVQAAESTFEEEEFDPRWELVHQLLEYQKFKQAAKDVGRLAESQADLYPRLVHPQQLLLPLPKLLKKADKLDLWHAFNQVLRRLSEKLVIGQIHDETITVSDRMEFILERLETGREFSFSSLFDQEETTSLKMIISTFLGVLELVRLKKITVWQDGSFSEIFFAVAPEEVLENVPADELEKELENLPK